MMSERTYHVWKAMKQRCDNPNNPSYANYGGRGITYCPRWHGGLHTGGKNFHEDMGDAPVGKSLDRKDNDGPYSKENCRWATKTEQEVNKRLRKGNISGYPDVSWDKRAKRWRARIKRNGVVTEIGSFDTLDVAIATRREYEADASSA